MIVIDYFTKFLDIAKVHTMAISLLEARCKRKLWADYYECTTVVLNIEGDNSICPVLYVR